MLCDSMNSSTSSILTSIKVILVVFLSFLSAYYVDIDNQEGYRRRGCYVIEERDPGQELNPGYVVYVVHNTPDTVPNTS